MSTNVETSWVKFGNCRDFALVGRDAIATASGVHVRFLDHRTGGTRIERFDGGDRGDGACRVAGHSVASIFSVAERKANPWISVFAYPTMRRISRCAESRRAIGYSCCAFVGTEYLLGQAIYPDFGLTVWHWRTGERLATVNETNPTTLGIDHVAIACSTDSARLVARFAASTGTLSVYRVLACSNTVRLFPLDVRFEHRPVSCSWSTAGTLLYRDKHGAVWSVDLDEDQMDRRRDRTIVRAVDESISRRNPALVGHDDGVLVFGVTDATHRRDVRATFYRKPWKDGNDEWQAVWTIALPSYPRHAESDPRRDGVLILGEDGNLYEMVRASREQAPRLECLLRGDVDYAAIVPLPGRYLGALDRVDGLAIVDAATGELVSSSARLGHHGKVSDLSSHPTSPILASCSETGNCLFVDASTPSCPRTTHCVHLQREPLDRVKFSDTGCLLGVAATRIGRLFFLSTSTAEPRVATWLNLGRKVLDFLIRQTDDGDVAKTLILVGNDESNPEAGNEILEYACRSSDRNVYREDADRSTKLPSSFERIHRGRGSSREIIGIPYLAKQLHRIELKEDPREGAFLVEALPSLHQTRGIEITVQRGNYSCLLTCGFDGLIVGRDDADPRRVFALFAAHHRSEEGGRRAVLVGDAIISLGRNGDLIANRLSCRTIERNGRSSRSTGSARRVTPDRLETRKTDPVDATHSAETQEEAETWVEATVQRRSMVEQREAIASRLSLLRDWAKVKRQITTLLDSNETAPLDERLPISAFDLDRESRDLAFAAEEERLRRDAEEQIARQDRASRYIREQFLDPLVVRPRSVFSLFGQSRVANYPLELAPKDRDLAAWCRFSMKTRELVSRLEDEDNPCTVDVENPWNSCHGFVEVFEACAIAEFREREAKERFDERFEQIRTAKRREITAGRNRAKEVRRLVRELRSTFDVDASSKLLEAPGWHPTEKDEDTFDVDASRREETDEDENNDEESEVEATDESKLEEFRRNALDEMMDGALEVRLEDNAKRNIPMPECLRGKDPLDYTEEDARAIESYEKKIRAREVDREKYRSTLESEIERISEEFSRSAKIFDEELNELSAEKIRVERSILEEKLSAVRTMIRHRRMVGESREMERAIESELARATKEARELCEQCDLFEAGVAEARIGYENACKRDRQLEGKFRGELAESKPSMVEYLFRQYRKRPALSGTYGACGASVSFLAELASCLVEERNSDVLPAECASYLRAANDLDAVPDGPSRRPELDHWRLTCRLRRLKMEAESKVKSCAIELAEAEQSLAFLRNACAAARDKVDRCKRSIELREAALEADSSTDRDVTLTLKTGQLRMRGKGCPLTDWEDAVPTPIEEATRVNRAIEQAEQRRSHASRRLAKIQELVSLEEWRHEREKTRMEDLLEQTRDLDLLKVSRVARECLRDSPSLRPGASKERPDEPATTKEKASVSRFPPVATRRKTIPASKRLATEIRTWRRRNEESTRKIELSTIERDDLLAASRDPLRLRVAAFRARGARASRRKARLAARIRDDLRELSILETRLETSKLRTYPTLKSRFR